MKLLMVVVVATLFAVATALDCYVQNEYLGENTTSTNNTYCVTIYEVDEEIITLGGIQRHPNTSSSAQKAIALKKDCIFEEIGGSIVFDLYAWICICFSNLCNTEEFATNNYTLTSQ